MPGLDKYWKDLSSDQLNLLNDTGFSSDVSEQTSVPVSGTVMFVTFIPSKQFEEGWWTQPCVDNTYIGTRDKNGFVKLIPNADLTTAQYRRKAKARKAANAFVEQGGIDIARALEVCQQKPPAPTPDTSSGDTSTPSSDLNEIPVPNDSHTTAADLFRNATSRPYKKWSGNALAIFRELTNVIVSGTHITEDTQLQPSLTALSCTTDDSGSVTFPQPEKDTLSCPVAGKNLDKVAKLRLRNAKDATDTTSAEGTVSVSGDSSNGTVVFPTSALHKLPQSAYTVFLVSNRGVEQKTSQTLHFSTDPVISDLSPHSTIDFSANPGTQTVKITGFHLANVEKVLLTGSDKSKPVEVELQGAVKTDTQLQVQLDPSKMKDLGTAPATVKVSLATGNRTFETEQQLQIKFAEAPAPKSTPKDKKQGTQNNTGGQNRTGGKNKTGGQNHK